MKQAMTRRARLRAGVPLGAFLLVVTGLTITASAVPGVTAVLSASARDVLRGQVWRLATSGLLAEGPAMASVVSFGLLASLTLLLCGPRVLWLSAVVGNVGSALLAYLLIGAIRLSDPGALAAEWRGRDYGVSAISAAWLGAIAATGWRARASTTARGAIAASCVAIGAFAYTLHPGIGVLASEHLTAFSMGAVVAALMRAETHAVSSLAIARRTLPRAIAPVVARRSALERIDPVAAGAVLATVLLVGGSVLPSGLASLREELLPQADRPARCARGPVVRELTQRSVVLTCQNRRDTLDWRFGPVTGRRSAVLRVVP
jgi:hypothetical protein